MIELAGIVMALGAVAAAGVLLVGLLVVSVVELVGADRRVDEEIEANRVLTRRLRRTVRSQGRIAGSR